MTNHYNVPHARLTSAKPSPPSFIWNGLDVVHTAEQSTRGGSTSKPTGTTTTAG